MKLTELPTTYREALAVFEIFRRLGVEAGNIFVGPMAGDRRFFVTAYHQGGAYTIAVGDLPADPLPWRDVCQFWNTAPPDEFQAMYKNAASVRHANVILMALYKAGFPVPAESPHG